MGNQRRGLISGLRPVCFFLGKQPCRGPHRGVVLYTHVELYTWGTRDTRGTRGTRDTPRGGYPGWIPGVGPDTLDTRDTRAARIYPGYPVPRAGGKPRQRLSALDLPTDIGVLSNQCCTLRQMRLLLVLLAALLAIGNARHVNFRTRMAGAKPLDSKIAPGACPCLVEGTRSWSVWETPEL